MFSDKKAQSMSINVIIVAIIAMIVLVLLVLIFTGRLNIFSQQTNACPVSATHSCVFADECAPNGGAVQNQYNCYDANNRKDDTKVCCVKLS